MKLNFDKILTILSIIIFIIIVFSFFNNKIKENIKLEKEKEIANEILIQKSKLEELVLEAKAVSVYNITKDKIIYSKNDDIPMPLASLVKTMSAIVAQNMERKENEIILDSSALGEVGNNGLYLGERWDYTELLKFSLMLSSNDGMYAITRNSPLFIDKMNEKAEKIGMQNTVFYNTTGLDEGINPGGVGTARDMNRLASFALHSNGEIFRVSKLPETTFTSLSNYKHQVQNTNIIANKIPNLLFSKTGNTILAGGNLTIIFKNSLGDEIAITVLGSTTTGRFIDMEKIVNLVL